MFENRKFEGLSYFLIVVGLLSPYMDKREYFIRVGHFAWLIVNILGGVFEGIRIQ